MWLQTKEVLSKVEDSSNAIIISKQRRLILDCLCRPTKCDSGDTGKIWRAEANKAYVQNLFLLLGFWDFV